MKAYKPILDRAGTTLILLGVTQIYLLIWKFFYTAPAPFPDGFLKETLILIPIVILWGSLFFIVPGVMLLRGSLKTAKYLRYLALISLATYALGGFPLLFVHPLDYYFVLFRLSPFSLLSEVFEGIVYVAFFFWFQHILGRPEGMNAQVDHRITPSSTWPPLWIGFVFAVIILVAFYFSFNGSSSLEAVQKVKTKYGNQYKYFVNTIHWTLSDSGTTVQAQVIGYDAQEVRFFTVQWTESIPGQSD